MPLVLNDQADGAPPLDTEFIAPCACPVCAGGVRYDDPQSFVPPTTGTAGNGLPIFSWDQVAAQLTRPNASWSSSLGTAAVVSYGFRLSADSMPNGVTGFVQFNASQIAFTTMILSLWSDVANITFNRVGAGTSGPDAYTNNATMLFANYTTGAEGAAAFAYYPSNASFGSVAGDVWVNISLADNATLVNGGFGPHTIAHEIGHAIGLAHPANYNSTDDEDTTVYPDDAVYWQDSRAYTVMSYFGSAGVGHSLNAFAFGPQLHDIAAVQRLYGANMTTRTGDTVYGFNSNTGLTHYTITEASLSPVFSIWDAGGIDTIDFSGYSTSTEIDLREQAFSSAGPGNGGVGVAVGNISIARGAVIENATGGSGADTLIGNNIANVLTGNDGNDRLTGGAGNDILIGGAGSDTAVFFINQDAVFLWSHGDVTAVLNASAPEFDRLTSVEYLEFASGTIEVSAVQEFPVLDYVASNLDLLTAFGANGDRSFDHYVRFGFFEDRTVDAFDGFQYTASYDDLIIALGDSELAAVQHFVNTGYAEGRLADAFDAVSYLASYDDVLIAFGLDESAAALHYVQYGFHQGRARDSFNGLEYIAGYDDLIAIFRNNEGAGTNHFVRYGFSEGRQRDAFDAFQYIASQADLLQLFGANASAATQHFILYGFDEGRSRDTFDAEQYLENYADLQAAFGDDLFAATMHYITYGFYEGRTDDLI